MKHKELFWQLHFQIEPPFKSKAAVLSRQFHLQPGKANGWAQPRVGLRRAEGIVPVLLHQQLTAPRTSSPVLDSRTTGQVFYRKSHTKRTSTAILAQLINSQSASRSSVSHQASQQLSNHHESPCKLTMKKPCTYLHLPFSASLLFSLLPSLQPRLPTESEKPIPPS